MLLWALALNSGFAQLQTTSITGQGSAPNWVYITVDDLPYEKWQGKPDTLDYFQYLHSVVRPDPSRRVQEQGIPATAFLVSCHFKTMPAALPLSSVCPPKDPRDQDPALIGQLRGMGFIVANHTHSHYPPLWFFPGSPVPSLTSAQFIQELTTTQKLLDQYPAPLAPNYFRAPGLNWGPPAAEAANADPYVSKLVGPFDTDVGGAFQLANGTWIGGDWDCPNQGLTAQQCGALYVRDIEARAPYNGVIVLLHNYVVPGQYALDLIHYIVENLPTKFQFGSLPELLWSLEKNTNPAPPHLPIGRHPAVSALQRAKAPSGQQCGVEGPYGLTVCRNQGRVTLIEPPNPDPKDPSYPLPKRLPPGPRTN